MAMFFNEREMAVLTEEVDAVELRFKVLETADIVEKTMLRLPGCFGLRAARLLWQLLQCLARAVPLTNCSEEYWNLRVRMADGLWNSAPCNSIYSVGSWRCHPDKLRNLLGC